jgi:peptide/nickel transport system substrate-binding protein
MKPGVKLLRSLFVVVGVLLLISSVLPGCTKEAVTPVKDTLIIGVTDTSPGIDCDIYSHPETWRLLPQVYACGLDYDYALSGQPGGPDVLTPVYGKIVPGLIDEWELSADGKVATFHLKEGVKSAYGNAFTTKDVLWKYQRAFALKAIGMYYATLTNFTSLDQLKIIDDYTFSVTIATPNPLLIDIMTIHYNYWFDSTEAKKHATADDPWAQEWIKRNGSCGLGPYTVTEWIPGDRIVLKANPNYFKGEPAIKNVIFKVVPESSTRLAMLKSGTIDVAYSLTSAEINSLAGTPGVNVIKLATNDTVWCILNNKIPPFDNKLVRQAINCAIPREQICETAYLGYATPWVTPLPGVMGDMTLSPEEFPYNYDLTKAKALLDEAGYENGFTVELAYDAGVPAYETMATLIKSSLAEIGVNVLLTKMTASALTTKVTSYEMPFALLDEMPQLLDPNYVCNNTFHSKAVTHYNNYYNAEVDELIEEGRAILDRTQRIEWHKNIQRIAMGEAPMAWTIQPMYLVAIRDNIKGWNWNTIQETALDMVHFAP